MKLFNLKDRWKGLRRRGEVIEPIESMIGREIRDLTGFESAERVLMTSDVFEPIWPADYHLERDEDAVIVHPPEARSSDGLKLYCVVGGEEVWSRRFLEGDGGWHLAIATSDPRVCCVISRGAGYLVPAARNPNIVTLPANDIRYVTYVKAYGALFLQGELSLMCVLNGRHVWSLKRDPKWLDVRGCDGETVLVAAGLDWEVDEVIRLNLHDGNEV